MSTIGNQLNILRDTQMVQRRRLEKMFPYIEWARMPFSSYGDFFRLRGILDDCGAVWTNAYGRSNTEADGQRNFLEDYSGNGRDIELFNFGYSRQSGFNGYVYGMNSFIIPEDVTGTKTERFISVTNTLLSGGTHAAAYYNVPTELKRKSWKVFVEKEDDVNVKISWFSADYSEFKNIPLNNGINTIPGLTEEESTVYLSMAIDLQHGKSVKITEIPSYPGALVSDGVDDYGQCVKDFALPDDYTVVAMREMFNDAGAPIVSKSHLRDNGAFILEANNGKTYSYGGENDVNWPKLFSYQTKNIYNGEAITSGTGTDTEEDKLNIFRFRKDNSAFCRAALYSFGIFTRTLTEDELRIVENCMYAEWIAMTGKLENIEYYDILDARFRSNDEDADKRNKWVGRLGKLHMTLHNYAYSGNSGWGGWGPYDLSKWTLVGEDVSVVGNRMTINKGNGGFSAYLNTTSAGRFTIKVYGVTQLVERGEIKGLHPMFRMSTSETSNGYALPLITQDGVYSKDLTFSGENDGIGFVISKNISSPITIELIPDYGGALISDGVDDYAVSDEVIDEEIKAIVASGEPINENTNYLFYIGQSGAEDSNRIGAYFSDNKICFYPNDVLSDLSADGIYAHSGFSLNPNSELYIARAFLEYGASALYQLRLIKTQPTDIQLEAIKWQCRKEHDDYLVHMGWKDDSPAWYGVEWDVTDSSPDVRRIGNMQMHRDLPVQSQMRGCLLDDNGVVLKYLNADDWTSETLDGSAGQVMVQAPVDSYWRFEKDGNIRRVKFATTRLPGFKRTPQGFISAHEATVQRSTNKLCSVVNTDPDYRGGSNKAEWDGTYRSLLGMPATNISRTTFRTYARNRKPGSTEWNCMTYDFQKLLYWLFVVEYATLNTQKPVNTEKDANGFSQGGLGNGVTNLNSTKWDAFNGYHPFIPCGYTDELGNGTGEVEFSMPEEYDSAGLTVKVPRYRGIENPFGHLWQWTDGINVRISPNEPTGDGLSKVFVTDNPEYFNDSNYDGYSHVGNEVRTEGYVKSVIFGEGGEIMPDVVGGGSTTYFCDYHYTNIPTSEALRGVLFGGDANDGAGAGFGYANSNNAPSAANASLGSRLCFIPA